MEKKIKIAYEEYDQLEYVFNEIEVNKDFTDDRKKLKPFIKPKVALAGPYNRTLIKDKVYFYCTCGYSKIQPFCDGQSHEGTGYKPLRILPYIDQTQYQLCGCRNNNIEVRILIFLLT